jgi:23S rRNA (uracil1939-C5)-methyltransferase
MLEGDLVEGTITRLGPDGDGVADVDGRELLVPGAFPGEVVSARILHLAKRRPLAHGKLVDVLSPRADRREAPCAQHPTRGGRCTGCPLLPLAEDGQRSALRDMLAREHGLEVDRVRHREDAGLGYRWSSKRVLFGGRAAARLGSFARGSHRPADMAGCLLEHPAIERAFAELVSVVNALEVQPYDERYGTGELRFAWAKTDGERVLLTLVTATEDRPFVERIAAALEVPAAVAWSVHEGGGNALRGMPPVLLRGAPLEAMIADVPFAIGPLGFLQPNPPMIAEAYRELVSEPGGAPRKGELAFDLYAGAGITTALLARSFARVIPCESYPESAEALGIAPRSVADFLTEVLASDDPELRPPDLVVANPPRRGLGAEVTDLLRRRGAPHVQIMACGPAGLAADIARLCADGLYELVRLEAFETLPQTPHVEIVAFLARR